MKFLVEFRRDGSLLRLKGAPLSLFILIGLHEAEILQHGADPLTVSDMERETGYSRPSVTQALDKLVVTNYVLELDERGKKNEKQYRVKSYMWFGAQRSMPFPSGESKPILLSPAKNFSSPDNNNNDSRKLKSQDEQSLLLSDGARKIFRALKVFDPALSELSTRVHPERAARWAEWVPLAPKDPYYAPVPYMIACLRNDPESEPPELDELLRAQQEERERAERELEYERKLAAGEIQPDAHLMAQLAATSIDPHATRVWQATLGELQLQMTKATFDTWVKPTFALGFDAENNVLRVGVRNAYAKQWLENRLYGMVERTVSHVIRKPAQIEFVLKNSNEGESQP